MSDIQNYTRELNKEWVVVRLPKRPKDANKGTFGKVLVIAGSENYPGSAYLSCAAAYRIGAGLVTLVTTPEVKIIVSRKLPELTFISEPFEPQDYDVLLLGPGLGQKDETIKFIKKLLQKKLPKTVIDGDGLNILAKLDSWQIKDTVLTPHPGEMSRLTGLSIEEIQKDREKVAADWANEWGQVVVLKGANTAIASPTGKVKISPFANPALATAGTGDVLSGIIAGFIAQGLVPFDGACCAVYIHGLAGEMVKEKIGDGGMLASDLLPTVPLVLKSFYIPKQ